MAVATPTQYDEEDYDGEWEYYETEEVEPEMYVEVVKPDYSGQINAIAIILGIIAGMIWVKNIWS